MEKLWPLSPMPGLACSRSLVSLRSVGWHLTLAQLQRLGPAARQILGSGAGGRKKQEREWGLRQVASVNKNTCRRKPVKSIGNHWFLQWQELLGSSAEQVTGNCNPSHCVAGIGSFCLSSSFLFVSLYFCFARLWVG